MSLRTSLSLIALAAALPGTVQAQSVSDFTLQPAPTPSATPQAQGPADTQNGVTLRPRAVNTPTPTPAPVPSATPTPAPRPTPTASAPAPVRPTPRATPLPTVTPREAAPASVQPQVIATPTTGESAPAATTTPAPQPTPTGATSPLGLPTTAAVPAEGEGDFPWLPLGGAALLALLGAGFFAWKRRRDAIVPEIERPVVASPTPKPAASVAEALQVRVEYDKLIRSMAFATLKYRMTLVNRTDSPLTDLSVGIDLVSAHAAAPMEEQVATKTTGLEERHTIARMAPRQSMVLEGEIRLAIAGANIIRQGRYPLLVPLMRVRVDGPGEGALLKTFVVGPGNPAGGRVQPIRLDEGPRTYAPIAQRELA